MWGLCVSVCACVCVCVCVCPPSSLSSSPLPVCVSLFCFGLKEAETITICTKGTGLPVQYTFRVHNTAAFFFHGRKKAREQKPNSWTSNFDEVSGHNLESSQTWVSVYKVYITNQFQTLLLKRGGRGRGWVKSISRGDCDFCPICV